MLKNIPRVLSPEMLKTLCEMGHGDRICIGDGNFPGAAMAKGNAVIIRADGISVPDLLDAILCVFPLDTYVETPVMLMDKMERDREMSIPIWYVYKHIIEKHDDRSSSVMGYYDRFQFYEEAKKCYCIIQTGESSQYANVILQKGLV